MHQAGRLIDAEKPTALPALRLTHRPQHPLQPERQVFGRGERAVHLVLQREQLFGTLTRRDIRADAAVADETAGAIDDRLAADAHVAPASVGCRAPHNDVAVWLVRPEQRAVCVPAALDLDAEFLARLADFGVELAAVA